MPLKLMYITNSPDIAHIAEESGVDWIWIDLEIIGKLERQGKMDTVISQHKMEDIALVKNALKKAKLIVRVNPIHEGSLAEIDQVIENGADIVMLPYFKNPNEVEQFLFYVNKRARTCLLLETPSAVDNLDAILLKKGIDFIHIGLNDLHLGYGMKFMFELLADGTVESICAKIKKAGIPYGFGGIAGIGQGTLPAEIIIAEHYRLGSSMAILSRSFCNTNNIKSKNLIREIFDCGMANLRNFEKSLKNSDTDFFTRNYEQLRNKVYEIVKMISSKE